MAFTISDTTEAISSVTKVFFLIIILVIITNTNARDICRNNGTLVIDGNRKTCSCLHPFTGQYCDDYACVNGLSTGLQYDPNSRLFNKRCLCDAGWTGALCSTSLHNRCGENGLEVNGKCHCNKNFVGDRCQFVTKCAHGQLHNGRCACHYGWSGDYCDQIVCYRGEADESKQACICPAKYRGKYCDLCAERSSSPPPECAAISNHSVRQMIHIEGHDATFIVVIAIAVVLLVLGILYCLLRHNVALTTKLAEQKTIDGKIKLLNTDCEL